MSVSRLRAAALSACAFAIFSASAVSAAQLPLTVLYTFTGGADGGFPKAGVVADSAGNLYGTAGEGGTGPCKGFFPGCGVVYEVSPTTGTETVLHDFQAGGDGAIPLGGLFQIAPGTFAGVTTEGGSYADCSAIGCGTVFGVTSRGQERVLYDFLGGLDGADPYAETLAADSSGRLYGTTDAGGSAQGIGSGTVFSPDATGETVLHRFGGPPDGALPLYGLTVVDGVLFGTTYAGGNGACGSHGQGCGTVFEIAKNGHEMVIHAFSGSDGKYPQSGLVADGAGNLYGTTNMGGANDLGTIYKIDRTGKETVLHSFAGGTTDGRDPFGNLTIDRARGDLYGTTEYGGTGTCDIGCGTV